MEVWEKIGTQFMRINRDTKDTNHQNSLEKKKKTPKSHLEDSSADTGHVYSQKKERKR